MSKKASNKQEQRPQNENTTQITNTVNSANQNKEHNTKKQSLGPNTKR